MAKKYKQKKPYTKKTKKYRKTHKFGKKFKKRENYAFQHINVERVIDYCVPSADLSRGTYGCYSYMSISSGSTTVNGYAPYAFDFRISDIPDVARYGSLFDQYMLRKVTLVFQYLTSTQSIQYPTNVGTGINPPNSIVTLGVIKDYDDGTTLTGSNAGWSELQESGRAKFHCFPNNKSNKLIISLTPRLLEGVQDTTGTIVAGRVSKSGWVDGALAHDVVFRGIKILLQVPPGDTEQQAVLHVFKCTAYYYLKFRMRK